MSSNHRLKLYNTNHQLYILITFLLIQNYGEVTSQEYPPTSFTAELASGTPSPIGVSKFLLCRTNSNPIPKYRWLKDGSYITNTTGSYSYRIDSISLSDVGRYRCEASNTIGGILSAPGYVKVAYMNQFDDKERQYQLSASIGHPIVIDVPNINSYPSPIITWHMNHQPMNTGGSRYQITLNGSLVLLDRTVADGTNSYKIEALNGNTNTIEQGPVYNVTVLASSGPSTPAPPTLIVAPVDKVAYEDQDTKVDFECIFNASPIEEVHILWYKIINDTTKDQLFSNNKYLLSAIRKRKLTIVDPKQVDNGVYQCEASLSGFVNTVASARLTVYVSPTFSNQILGVINKDFGQTVTVNCTASGFPTPSIHWYFNTQELGHDFNSSSYTLHSNGSLTISQLDLEHAGVYQCFLRNVAGETSKATWLKVNSSPPEMVSAPSDITILEGGNARFTCETKGAPKPDVRWFRESTGGVNEEIMDSGRIQILERGELLIVSTRRDDSGRYTCNSSNSQGHISASALLTVYMITQIDRPPQNQRIIKGSTAVFYCGVSNDPNIQVTWRWSHRALHTDTDIVIVPDEKRSIADDGTLTIIGIINNDIGSYTCHVTSTGGNDTKTVSLTVIELPMPPAITSVNFHSTDVRAIVVKWVSGYDGNTPITKYSIQYKEVKTDGSGSGTEWLTSDANIQSSVQEATVTRLRPAGHYQFRVFASNEVGEGLPSEPKPDPPIEMPQQPPSSPPKGLGGSPETNTSVLIRWQPPDEDSLNGVLQGYIIQYKLAGYSTFQNKTVTLLGMSPQYILQSLAYFQEYQIRIAAYNIKGVGVFSGLINVTTFEGHPTAPPENLEAVANNSTSIRVRWTPPNQQFINGRNLGYKVLGKRLGAVPSEFVSVVAQDSTNPTGVQTTILDTLLKYTEYNVTVLCYTSRGDGPRAVAQTVRTMEDFPSQVSSLTFSDIRAESLQVNWLPPTQINGIITSYTVIHVKEDDNDTYQEMVLSATNLTYTVYNLSPMTKYIISVVAFTSVGPGPPKSAYIESGVPPEPPTAPINLGVSNIAARSVLLQFLPGFDGKTSITLWIVEALEGMHATQWKSIYEVDKPTARSLQVENLKPYTHYQLRITAENIVNRSLPSVPSRLFQTIQDAPGAPPGNVTVRALNATALRVSWTPLSKNDWNGEPRGYKIYYKLNETTADFQVIDLDNAMNMDSSILGGLQEWMQHEVKMIAYNDVGDSIYSPVMVERTRESVPSVGPQTVQAMAISSTSVNVSWGEVPTLQQNGMIQGFKVEYRSSERNIPTEPKDVSGNTTSSVIVQNLRKFVRYEIRVLAYTRMGDGRPSAPEVVVQTNADVPGPPQTIRFPDVSYSLVTVVWEPPAEPNGIITGYMVSYKLRDSGDDYVNSSALSFGTRNYTVGNLQKQAYYEFRVTAQTALGWGQTASVEVFTMANRSEPDSPSNPTIKSSQVQARSVTISWIPAPFNGYGPLRNFTVQYKSGQSWISVKEHIPPSITTYPVQGLRPNTGYVFRVRATNDKGSSPYSVQSDDVQTLEDKPEGAPRHVMVERLTTTSVRVTWEQPLPDMWNGDLLGYVLMYRQAENSNYMDVKIISTEKVLLNLSKKVNYEFLVKAYNSAGKGPASTPVTVFVGEAAPTAPPVNVETRALNSTEIQVTWQPPPLDTQNGDLSGYRVSYWRRSDSENTAKKVTNRDTHVVLDNLHIYTEYSISVQAINLAGEGPGSVLKYEKTLEGLPGRPASIQFWNVTDVSLDVQWGMPITPNGKIVNYELSYREENSAGRTTVGNIDGRLNEDSIKNLHENSTYLFSVSARTAIGKGERTEKSLTIGPQTGGPKAPSQLTVTMEASGQKLHLDWFDEPGDHIPIYEHRIQAKQADSIVWTLVQQINNHTRTEINLLQFIPNTEYQLRVFALNQISMSPYSVPSALFRTPDITSLAVAKARAFHYEWWFLVIVALTGLVVILVVISLLCLVSRNTKHEQRKGRVLTSTSILAPSMEPEDGGFGNLEMTQGRQSTHSRRHKFAGIRNGSVNNIYARSPPRPSPASVAYSDDDGASSVKPPLPDDDDDTGSSCTEKPSEIGDSSEASDEASDDDDSLDFPPPPPPSSPPPPPFSHAINNLYTTNGATAAYASGGATAAPSPPSISNPYTGHRAPALPERGVNKNNSWQNQNNSSFNAYQYTDSEAESSHYAFSLNGGQIVLNNTAGSRAPLPGFSSFV